MKRPLAVLAIVGLAACATAPEAPPPAPEKTTLSDAAFKVLWNAAYKSEPESDSEIAFGKMLERDDLTPKQRGEVYYGRGTLRGIYVRDWDMAYPQCALGDLLKAVEYPLTEARWQQTAKSIRYQYDRKHHFPKAPESCAVNVETASTWLADNTTAH